MYKKSAEIKKADKHIANVAALIFHSGKLYSGGNDGKIKVSNCKDTYLLCLLLVFFFYLISYLGETNQNFSSKCLWKLMRNFACIRPNDEHKL